MSEKEKNAKLKVLELTLGKLEKSYGKGVVMKLGDKIAEDIDVIPTGSIGLDLALGVGGYPRGRVIEIYGPESSGKTTLAIHAIAECQKQGGICASYAECKVEIQTPTGNHIHIFNHLVSELHHGALSVCLVQSIHGQLEGFEFVCVYRHVNWF